MHAFGTCVYRMRCQDGVLRVQQGCGGREGLLVRRQTDLSAKHGVGWMPLTNEEVVLDMSEQWDELLVLESDVCLVAMLKQPPHRPLFGPVPAPDAAESPVPHPPAPPTTGVRVKLKRYDTQPQQMSSGAV